ncbi:hypothetical protein TRICI_006374 [Trichomonascus ciferrii]|uniref:High osmolarity signaling protein SHO1 n=1 Tax=Trichomonascus ciferrii TaxID=44093 RepID=A0A642UHP9_9ASCO|nr:hypothetical protein TRICI_006374 [Trichomonascus ciferrii]
MAFQDTRLGGRRRAGRGFSVSLIVGDPFALSTISIAVIGWVIALAGSIAVDVSSSSFPTLTWWGIAFEFCVIVGVIYTVGASALHAHRTALVGFLATATIYTTNSTNNSVWKTQPSNGAVAAGHILLSIINILWMLYFGTTDDARLHAFVDSFAIHHHHDSVAYGTGTDSMARRSSNPFMAHGEGIGMNYRGPPTGQPHEGPPGRAGGGGHPAMFTSAQLGGAFENSSGGNGLTDEDPESDSKQNSLVGGSEMTGDVLSTPSEYPYKARALYSYQASPDDANEISFEKGEILEVSDITGRWWQARRENGEVGICPSNYVHLER